jgi:hypothetical protein
MFIILVGMITIIIIVCIFSNSNQFLLLPLTTPEKYLSGMPHFTFPFFSHEVVFIQPSSSFFVYSLGLIMILVGVFYFKTRGVHKSRNYWGIGLILWGISALVAGTSYQAFGYELKCADREFCLFTSNFELVYMLLTAYSINFLVAATGYTSLGENGSKWIIRFAVLDSFLYSVYLFIGAIVPIRFLISYEGFMSFVGVNFILMFILNIRHFIKFKDTLNRDLIGIWFGFLGVNLGYFIFLLGGIGQKLYASTGFWFNENDVLHILLILWALLIFWIMRKDLRDDPSISQA